MLSYVAFAPGFLPNSPVVHRSSVITRSTTPAAVATKPKVEVAGVLRRHEEIQPGRRYREAAAPEKYYSGRNPAYAKALTGMSKDLNGRKIVVITGSSSGLGLYCVEALNKEDYFFIAAVRDPDKMHEAAAKAGEPRSSITRPTVRLATARA